MPLVDIADVVVDGLLSTESRDRPSSAPLVISCSLLTSFSDRCDDDDDEGIEEAFLSKDDMIFLHDVDDDMSDDDVDAT